MQLNLDFNGAQLNPDYLTAIVRAAASNPNVTISVNTAQALNSTVLTNVIKLVK